MDEDRKILTMPEYVINRLHAMSKILNFTPKNILDIGAYKGFWSEDIKKVYPNSNIFMIEGDSERQEDLKKTGMPFQIALLSDMEKDVVFHRTASRFSTGNSLYRELTTVFRDGNEGYSQEQTTATTLQKIAEKHDLRPDMIKLDVQGAEKDVIMGGLEVVRNAKVLFIEISVIEYNKGAPDLVEMINFMDQIGFYLFDIVHLHYTRVINAIDQLSQFDAIFVRK